MMISKRKIETALAIAVTVGVIFFLFISPGSIPFFGHEDVPENTGPQELAVGGTGGVENLLIEPLSILEDSRCPIGVQCVWAGRIVAQVKFTIGDTFDNRSIALGETVSFGEYLITLAAVSPEKTEGQQINDEDYRLTFDIKKVSQPGDSESTE
jgi:hypothetical protein